MAIFSDLSRVVRMTIEGRLFEQQIINVLHYKAPPEVAVIPDNLLVGFQTDVLPTMLGCVSNNYTAVKLSWRTLLNPVQSGELILPANTVGVLGDGAMPTQVAGLISWRTGFAGRNRRGRTYLAGIPEDRINSSRLTAQEQAALQAFADDALLVSAADGDWGLVIVSDPLTQLPATSGYVPPAPSAADVIAALVRDVPGTQRRRRIGVGS